MSNDKKITPYFISTLFVAVCISLYMLWSYDPSEIEKEVAANIDQISNQKKDKPKTLKFVYGDIKPGSSSKKSTTKEGNTSLRSSSRGNHKLSPNSSVDQKILEARDLIDGGNPNKAKSILEEILRNDPNNESALVELGLVELIDMNNPAGAKLHLEKALSKNPNNRMVISELVGIYEQGENMEEGLHKFKQLQEQNPESSTLSWAIGQTLVNMGKESEAINYLENASKDSEQPYYILTDLADAYSQSGMQDKALETYKKAIIKEKERNTGESNNGSSAERLTFLQVDYARELIRQDRFDEAEEVLYAVKERSVNESETVSFMLEKISQKRKRL